MRHLSIDECEREHGRGDIPRST